MTDQPSTHRSARYMLYRWWRQGTHRLGHHRWHHIGPMPEDGREWDRCDWCGAIG